MAGIGFELKKVFNKKGVMSKVRASSYAGTVSAGPMLLGMCMLVLVRILAGRAGITKTDAMLISGMVTVCLISSMIASSLISLVVSRYASDQLYEKNHQKLLPAFYGSSAFGIVIAFFPFLLLLFILQLDLLDAGLFLFLFLELILIWNEMNFLTIIKSYKGIFFSFAVALLCAVCAALLLFHIAESPKTAMIVAIILGFSTIFLLQYILLRRELPKGAGADFEFLSWYKKYPLLPVTGVLMNLGLYIPIILVWLSPIGRNIVGRLYVAPDYDIATMFAFLTTLPVMIGFIGYVETEFHTYYRRFFYYLSHRGSLMELQQSQGVMLMVMKNGIYHLGVIQLGITVLCVSLVPKILIYLPLGFNNQVSDYFRLLCVAFGMYILADLLHLLLLYFADYRGGFLVALVFALTSTIATVGVIWSGNTNIYGFGFFLSAVIFFLVAMLRMEYFFPRLSYFLLSRQPISRGEDA